MPYQSGDIKFYGSAGMLGGSIGNILPDNALHAVFQPLTADDLREGITDYACIYIKNTTTNKTFYRVRVYIKTPPDGRQMKEKIELGLDPQSGSPVQTIPNRTTPPNGVSFSLPLDYATGLEVGTLPPGGTQAIWLRRTVPPNTDAATTVTVVLAVEGFAL